MSEKKTALEQEKYLGELRDKSNAKGPIFADFLKGNPPWKDSRFVRPATLSDLGEPRNVFITDIVEKLLRDEELLTAYPRISRFLLWDVIDRALLS